MSNPSCVVRHWLTLQKKFTTKNSMSTQRIIVSTRNFNQFNLQEESNKRRRTVHIMRKQDIFVILLVVVMLIKYSEEQGSASNSIAAYITLYKARKKLRLERERKKVEKLKKWSIADSSKGSRQLEYYNDSQRTRYNCAKFPFYYSSCFGDNYYWQKLDKEKALRTLCEVQMRFK